MEKFFGFTTTKDNLTSDEDRAKIKAAQLYTAQSVVKVMAVLNAAPSGE